MKVRVLYFAVFREKLGREEDVVALAEGARVRDAVAVLAQRHAVIAALQGRFRVAVNQDFSDDERALADGDELALIPPVAGGAEAGGSGGEPGVRGGASGARHVWLGSEPLSLDRCIARCLARGVAAVGDGGMGGLVTFTGMVRRHSRGAQVDHLEYEAYGAMALREMTRLCDEIEAEIAGAVLAVEHRVGRLAVGDLAVVIAAAAPHRAEAFAACRAMIDRLKARVPIWKKEVGDDGAEWVGLGP